MGTIVTINTSNNRLFRPQKRCLSHEKRCLLHEKRCLKSAQNSREKLQNNLQTLKNDTEIPKVLTSPSSSPTLLSINEQYSRCPREVISCPRCLLLVPSISIFKMKTYTKKQKKSQLFGNHKKSLYLCSVKRGFRRKDDNLYGLRGRFEPQK